MVLRDYFEARAVPQAGSERGHAQSCAGGAEGCCAARGEAMPCTRISAGLPPMTWPQETGCKPRVVQKQFPLMVVSEESQDWQQYFSCGDTITIFSVPDNILSS